MSNSTTSKPDVQPCRECRAPYYHLKTCSKHLSGCAAPVGSHAVWCRIDPDHDGPCTQTAAQEELATASEQTEEAPKPDPYNEILAGTVGLGYLDCTLLEYARGIKYYIDQELRKPNCDTHLINMLRRAACVGWENIKMFGASPITVTELSVADCLAELRELFPDWKYFAITVSIGAPRKRCWIKLGPSFYSAVVKDAWGETLSEAMSQVRAYHTAITK